MIIMGPAHTYTILQRVYDVHALTKVMKAVVSNKVFLRSFACFTCHKSEDHSTPSVFMYVHIMQYTAVYI